MIAHSLAALRLVERQQPIERIFENDYGDCADARKLGMGVFVRAM